MRLRPPSDRPARPLHARGATAALLLLALAAPVAAQVAVAPTVLPVVPRVDDRPADDRSDPAPAAFAALSDTAAAPLAAPGWGLATGPADAADPTGAIAPPAEFGPAPAADAGPAAPADAPPLGGLLALLTGLVFIALGWRGRRGAATARRR